MCDHVGEKRIYRNISYCKKCELVLGPIYKFEHIRTFKQRNLKNVDNLSDIFENEIKLKIKNEKSLENMIF